MRNPKQERMSLRQRQVSDLLAEGLGSTAIARRLGINRHTVATYKRRIEIEPRFRVIGLRDYLRECLALLNAGAAEQEGRAA